MTHFHPTEPAVTMPRTAGSGAWGCPADQRSRWSAVLADRRPPSERLALAAVRRNRTSLAPASRAALGPKAAVLRLALIAMC